MRTKNIIQIISCHAEGEVGNVIVGGVRPPPGDTLWQQSRWIDNDKSLRNLVLNEPRGGVFKHINLLVPAKDARAEFGFIIMEPEHTPPMSGSNSICVATVLLDSGMIDMQEPITEFMLEAPGGLVAVKANCRDGKAQSIRSTQRPVIRRSTGCQSGSRGARHPDSRHCLRRRQFRHRRRGGTGVRHQTR